MTNLLEQPVQLILSALPFEIMKCWVLRRTANTWLHALCKQYCTNIANVWSSKLQIISFERRNQQTNHVQSGGHQCTERDIEYPQKRSVTTTRQKPRSSIHYCFKLSKPRRETDIPKKSRDRLETKTLHPCISRSHDQIWNRSTISAALIAAYIPYNKSCKNATIRTKM